MFGPRVALITAAAPDRVRRRRDAARLCWTSSRWRLVASEFTALSVCLGSGFPLAMREGAKGLAAHAGGSNEPFNEPFAFRIPIAALPELRCRARPVRQGASPARAPIYGVP